MIVKMNISVSLEGRIEDEILQRREIQFIERYFQCKLDTKQTVTIGEIFKNFNIECESDLIPIIIDEMDEWQYDSKNRELHISITHISRGTVRNNEQVS